MTIEPTVFKIGDKPLKSINKFKYLGRMLEKSNIDWAAVTR
jgi:hypothetical protein